jgi:RNA polymerase sigma factor (sigma-70 family)
VEQLFRDGNRDALVGELCNRVSRAEAEDLIQRSIERALSGRCHAEHIGGVHAWVRQDAQFALSHLFDRRRVAREKLVCERNAMPRPNEIPDVESQLAQQENVELATRLVREAGLSPLDQSIVRLYWGEQLPRKRIANELGIAEGTLKKRLARAGTAFEALLVKRCGGGCGEDPERLVRAYAFQHRTQTGHDRALALRHIGECESCARLFDKLEQVRLGTAALVPAPAPAVEQADPGAIGDLLAGAGKVLGRLRQDLTETVGSLRHYVEGGTSQAKQQASVAYYRMADPTPLASLRPGSAAVLIGGCIAAAGGSAYCVEQGIDPVRGLARVVAPQHEAASPSPPPVSDPPAVVTAPLPSQPVQTPDSSVPSTSDASSAPSVEPEPPPPEQEFEPLPTATGAQAGTTGSFSSGSADPTPSPSPANTDGGSEFAP